MSVAILGSGSLSTELQKLLPHSMVFRKPKLNFLDQNTITDCVPELLNFNTIINCIGLYNGETKEILEVNFLSPILLTEQLSQQKFKGHLVMIGSHAATWSSWPGITQQRLVYANSKLALRNYMFGLAHSKTTDMSISVVDLTKFKSNMSNFEGYDIEATAKLVVSVIQQDIKILHVEAY